jgi:hypothetical protein
MSRREEEHRGQRPHDKGDRGQQGTERERDREESRSASKSGEGQGNPGRKGNER